MNKKLEKIERVVRDMIPEYPTSVSLPAEDDGSLLVFVYAVPQKEMSEVIDRVCAIEYEHFPEEDFYIVPMVKSIATTRKHFPQYLPVAQGSEINLLDVILRNCSGSAKITARAFRVPLQELPQPWSELEEPVNLHFRALMRGVAPTTWVMPRGSQRAQPCGSDGANNEFVKAA